MFADDLYFSCWKILEYSLRYCVSGISPILIVVLYHLLDIQSRNAYFLGMDIFSTYLIHYFSNYFIFSQFFWSSLFRCEIILSCGWIFRFFIFCLPLLCLFDMFSGLLFNFIIQSFSWFILSPWFSLSFFSVFLSSIFLSRVTTSRIFSILMTGKLLCAIPVSLLSTNLTYALSIPGCIKASPTSQQQNWVPGLLPQITSSWNLPCCSK